MSTPREGDRCEQAMDNTRVVEPKEQEMGPKAESDAQVRAGTVRPRRPRGLETRWSRGLGRLLRRPLG